MEELSAIWCAPVRMYSRIIPLPRGGCIYISKHSTNQVPALDPGEDLLYKIQEFTFFPVTDIFC